MSEPPVLAYTDKESEYVFHVFSYATFMNPAFFNEKARKDILKDAGTLCSPGVSEDYIQNSLNVNFNPEIETDGWLGILETHSKMVGVIVFRDLRPRISRVDRDFICGPSQGKTLNMFFEMHIVTHGQKLGDYRDVVVTLDSINARGVLEYHEGNGYVRTGEVLNSNKHPFEHLIVMKKKIEVPHLGGQRRTRRRRQILLTYRRRYGRNERASLRRKARRNA